MKKTEYALRVEALVKQAEVTEYYDDMMGCLRIPESDVTGINKALEFIKVMARNNYNFAIEYEPNIGIDGDYESEKYFCVREVERFC